MATVTPSTCVDVILDGCQDYLEYWRWGFDLIYLFRKHPSDSLQSVVWTLPSPLVKGAGGDGVLGTLAYTWIDASLVTILDVEYQCIAKMTTTEGRIVRGRLDLYVKDLEAQP